jgi:Lipoprotein LpqB beta-propeller domain/Sporulation and spore germination
MARRPAGRRQTKRRRAAPAARALCCAAAIASAASGCALVSPSGTVHEVGIPQVGSDQNQEQPQLLPRPPGKGWTPAEIVNGFVAASASFANNYAIARLFLTPSEAASWHPDGSVTVVDSLQHFTPPQNEPKRQPDQPSNKVTHVNVMGAQLATLTGTGQYLASSAPAAKTAAAKNKYIFTLVNVGNNWRISQLQLLQGTQLLPQQQLMLTKDELERAYQQRNLYFLDPTGRILVPDPVFVPQNDTNSDVATRLVNGLLKNPVGWLAGAAGTAFPRQTVAGPVRINGPTATVELAMPAAAAKAMKPAQRAQLAAQLVWTLTSTSYGPAAIQIVQIQVNGHTLALNGSPYQRPKQYQDWVPEQPKSSGPYFISRAGQVKELSSPGLTAAPQAGAVRFAASPVDGQAGSATVPALSDIAIEPDEGSLAGLAQDRKTVYIGDLSRGAALSAVRLGGTFDSLSWDRKGDLWMAAGNSSVWMLAPGSGSQDFNALDIPPKGVLPSERLTALRVAPDGVRVAMIVQTRTGASQVLLGAISGNGPGTSIGETVAIGAQIQSPQDLTWYDADHLIVLTNPGPKAQLEAVPLNGGQPTPVSTDPGTTSVTSDGAGLAVGLSNGGLAITPSLEAPWQQAGMLGSSPAYPG